MPSYIIMQQTELFAVGRGGTGTLVSWYMHTTGISATTLVDGGTTTIAAGGGNAGSGFACRVCTFGICAFVAKVDFRPANLGGNFSR